MKNVDEILAYLDEQLWYTEKQAIDNGVKISLLASLQDKQNKELIEQKYWLFQSLKIFIEGKI